MAIRIGHSSIDERGKASGGVAGDQGKEVVIANWYVNNWTVVLRPKNTTIAEKSAKFVEQICANQAIGYDQSGRNTLYKEAKAVNFDGSKIKTPCECDCSSFMHTAAIAGGANISYGSNGATTRTLRTVLGNSGYYEVLTDSKYLTSDKYLKRGDIIVKEGSHTIMALENGTEASSISTPTVPTRNYLIKGDKGNEVKALQENLNYLGYSCGSVDGDFGSKTDAALRKFQKDYKLVVDGEYGKISKAKLESLVAEKKKAANKPSTGTSKVIGTAVAKTSMKIRTSSNTSASSKVIGYVKQGEKVEVLEVLSNGWYKIVCNKASCGYAYTSNSGGKYYTYTKK